MSFDQLNRESYMLLKADIMFSAVFLSFRELYFNDYFSAYLVDFKVDGYLCVDC
jgi:hypothetical protein